MMKHLLYQKSYDNFYGLYTWDSTKRDNKTFYYPILGAFAENLILLGSKDRISLFKGRKRLK